MKYTLEMKLTDSQGKEVTVTKTGDTLEELVPVYRASRKKWNTLSYLIKDPSGKIVVRKEFAATRETSN